MLTARQPRTRPLRTVRPQGQNDDGNYDVDGNGILTQHTLKPSFPCAADRCSSVGGEMVGLVQGPRVCGGAGHSH